MALYVAESGKPGTPAIVFLHGLGVGGWMWQPQTDLMPDYHCLVVDLPGHGRSQSVEWVSLADTAGQVAAVIRERTPDGQAHIVGLSLGGYITLHLISAFPENVDHAIITGIAALPHPALTISRWLSPLMSPLLRSETVTKASARSLNLDTQAQAAFIASSRQLAPQTFIRAVREASPFHLPPRLADFPRPILVVGGQKENALVRRSIPVIVQALPQASGVTVPEVNHIWNMEKPELFAWMIRAWIGDGPLPDALKPVS